MGTAEETFLQGLSSLQEWQEKRKETDRVVKEKQLREWSERAAENAREGSLYAKQIFEWAWNFTRGELGQKTLSLMKCDEKGFKTVTFFQNFDYDGLLSIRGGGDGFLSYDGRDYKGETVYIVIDHPESLAYRVDHRFLQKACEEIENNIKGIYKRIFIFLFQQLKIRPSEL